MSEAWPDIAGLTLLTAAYWFVDLSCRRGAFTNVLRRLGLQSVSSLATVTCGMCFGIAMQVPWSALTEHSAVRLVASLVSCMLAWKATTRDIDLVQGDFAQGSRILLSTGVIGVGFSPVFLPLVAWLLSTPFATWEHHATLPMRLLQAITAWAILGLTPYGATVHVLFWFLLVIQISHYLISAVAKAWLGPKWYSWITDNQMHHLAASAYSWGWAKFLPWERWRRVISAIQRVEKPAQLLVFGIEALAPLALLSPTAGIVFCLGWSAFHLGVFGLSGLLFWDWVGANIAVALGIWTLPTDVISPAFGVGAVCTGLIFTVVFPFRHKLWKPIPLGWWDTPFTQRIHWYAHGQSGRTYGVYADVMCPHERLFGKVGGCFFAPIPVVTYHLGEVWKHELRDAIRAAGPNMRRLDAVREQFGVLPRSEALSVNHVQYLRRFFYRMNEGARKSVLPPMLRWMKAPGGQVFYWGDLPPYRGQERITRVTLHYREEYFDGDSIHRLCDEQVADIPIDASAALVEPVEAPTPRDMDDFLLSFAAGRLIDLPNFVDGYLQSDDGKRPPA